MTEIYFVLRTKPGEVLTMPPVWFWVLGWFLTTVAVVGNGFVIYLITTKRRLHTTTNWFILSLSVADFCFGSSYLPSLFACEIVSCKTKCPIGICLPTGFYFSGKLMRYDS